MYALPMYYYIVSMGLAPLYELCLKVIMKCSAEGMS